MSYPFVQAKWYSSGAINEVRALIIHFAEGGNTVHYFQTTDRDVSAHFVLQYDGTIVQMVRDGDADHCQHVDIGSWTYAGGLTRKNGVAVLGTDVMDSTDHTRVNRYVHAIEIEGFRARGMNPDQEAALTRWVAERRARFPTIRGVLGHGDVQDKACPGPLIPWAALGGHGLSTPTTEVEMPYELKFERWKRTSDGVLITTVGAPKKADGTVDYSSRLAILSSSDGSRRLDLVSRSSIDPVSSSLDDAFYKGLTSYSLDTSSAVNAALDHVAPAVTALETAITEARPR